MIKNKELQVLSMYAAYVSVGHEYNSVSLPTYIMLCSGNSVIVKQLVLTSRVRMVRLQRLHIDGDQTFNLQVRLPTNHWS